MAFKGDLTNISLFDVFQTLSQNKQTGVLVLTRDGQTKKVHISPDGVRIFFSRSFRPLRLGEIFVRRGRITQQDVEILLLEQKKQYRPMGELLIESGKITEEEVGDVLRYHAEDEIFEVFGWQSGTFAFYDGQDAGDPSTPLSDILMDPAGLCLEAARRLDELERLREAIPNDTEYYVAEGDPPSPEEVGTAATGVFAALGQPNSIDELRDLAGLSLHDTLAGVQTLLARSLIRTLTLDELLAVAAEAEEAGDLDRAARLLEKAHAHEPNDRAILEQCVAVFGRLNQPKPLAAFLATLGKVCFVAGETETAIEHLEEALRSDGTHMGALAALRDAYVQLGDAERVAEVSLRLARAEADQGDLARAIDTCREGIEQAPQAVALRFFHAQILARSGRVEEAREEVYEIVRATEATRGPKTDRAYELLTNCYRFLLKIDPSDAEADKGLQEIDRRRMAVLRRRKLVTRGGAAAALLLVFVGIGLATGGESAESLATEIRKAQQKKNTERVLELADELVAKHPDSPEAKWAAELRRSLSAEIDQTDTAKREREKAARAVIDADLEEVRAAVADRPPGEAIAAARRLVAKLGEPEMAFLRKTTGVQMEYMLGQFFERVQTLFEDDRKQLAAGEVQLRTLEGKAAELRELEEKLFAVRRRNWVSLAPELTQSLLPISASQAVGKAAEEATKLAQRLATGPAAFQTLDSLLNTVRRERFKAEVLDLHRVATTQGQNFLTECDFDRARAAYEAVQTKLAELYDQEPRDAFLDLINWLDLRTIPVQTRVQIERIDRVVKTLGDIDGLRKEGKYAAAYRVMRDLVSENRLVRFEAKYRLPYLVTSVPTDAEVEVNGVKTGITPCEIALDIGQKPMTVTLRKPGFEDAETQIVPIDPDLDGSLEVDLEKELAWDHEVAGTGIEAYPSIADGMVLFATTDATLLAVDLESGRVRWEARTGLLARIRARPVVAGDSAYLITLDGLLHQVRLKDGKIMARIELGAKVEQDPVAVGDTLYVATRRPSLVAVRRGATVWEEPLTEGPTTPVVYLDGNLYVGTTKGAILVHDAKTGASRREFRVTSNTSFWGGLTVHKHLILAGAEDGKLYAFDTKTGSQAWAYPTGGPIACPAVSDGNRIYLPTRDGYIHVLTTEGAEEMDRLDMGYAVRARAAVCDGFLYFLGSNRVKAFDSAGKLWWDRTFEGEFPAHVIAGGDRVIVVTDKPWIHAFPKDVK
ncbi:MAG TPA: PQQ-binding-like beta-propeller repeat protein [Planctomycetota bacterium]|nr:PQQ-binding-like beta-propeller repeat protein [Planctomycetota bacterium]